MITYKGFNKDLTCRGFQYEEGKTYKHDGDVVRCAEGGFHSCENPLDIFSYYSPAESVFHEVEIGGTIDVQKGEDTKVASGEITIKGEIKIPDIVSKSIEWINSKIDKRLEQRSHNTGNGSAASNTGDYSAASNTGYRSAASNTGNCSAASNTGYCSAASNTGDYSAASNTGNGSAASNTGYRSAASNTGDCSAAEVSGRDSVAISSGRDSKARASLGSAIVLVYRDEDYKLIHIKSAIIDNKELKENIWYKLDQNGNFIEDKGE